MSTNFLAGEERERERERDIYVREEEHRSVASRMRPDWVQTHNFFMYRTMLQLTEVIQPGLQFLFLKAKRTIIKISHSQWKFNLIQ